jgi:hypothetical protein
LSPYWFKWLSPDIFGDTIELDNSKVDLKLFVKPKGGLEPNIYNFKMLFDSGSSHVEKTLSIAILDESLLNTSYERNIKFVSSILNSKVNPGDTVQFEVGFENRNPLDIGDVVLDILGDYIDVSEVKDLGSKVKDAPVSSFKFFKVYSFEVPFDALPVKNLISVKILKGNEELYDTEKDPQVWIFNLEDAGFILISQSKSNEKINFNF